jgi:hypothetical protein
MITIITAGELITKLNEANPGRFTPSAIKWFAGHWNPEYIVVTGDEDLCSEMEEWSTTKDIVALCRDMECDFYRCSESNEVENSTRDLVEFLADEGIEIHWTGNEWVYRSE